MIGRIIMIGSRLACLCDIRIWVISSDISPCFNRMYILKVENLGKKIWFETIFVNEVLIK